MKLDPSHFAHMSNTEFRVLTAIELGMRNHEFIPVKLITATANLRSCGMSNVLASLTKSKLIVHSGESYDGYKLTFLGLDYLALRSLHKRGVIGAVGRRIGVGKEADVHLCTDTEGNLLVLKIHRLGRVSFRAVKHKRDYMGKRKHASWMYLSQLAAKKEFSYLSALWDEEFPVPQPLDINRHVIAMKFVDGIPLSQVRAMTNPRHVLNKLMRLIVRLARVGIIHGDFNGFNLMISEDGEHVTVIDFPQVVSVTHPDAAFYFDRDVECIRDMFRKKFKLDVFEYPVFSDVIPNPDDIGDRDRLKLKVVIDKVDDNILSEILQHLRHEEGAKQGDTSVEDISTEMSTLSIAKDDNDGDTSSVDYSSESHVDSSSDGVDESDSATGSDTGSDYESGSDEGDEREEKCKPIQIWTPHVKKIGANAYGRRLNSRARNKAKAETKKGHRARKQLTEVKLAVKSANCW
ncbi:RIO kinase family protein [Babesia bovis T2Bo]|uniref:Serine/threonine-protein kinase RIO2 n=1 Tax=Babesia bovis TaxID=5865 RepID=A7APL1_BABBO|nr:RIO kinase family protein [Babesia bovis T2Bo]EDO08495.1 RIO kinase family protein [Babesia bovis T2Bo]|eukprot:XP_001612063.1 RIO1 family protein [Babesia bovis T2Bo]